MKKFALALVLVMVLSASALAAAPTLSGAIQQTYDYFVGVGAWALPDAANSNIVLAATGDNYLVQFSLYGEYGTLSWMNVYLKAKPGFVPGTLYLGRKYSTSSDALEWQGVWYNGVFGPATLNAYYNLQSWGGGRAFGDYKGDVTYKFGAKLADSIKVAYRNWDYRLEGTLTVPVNAFTFTGYLRYAANTAVLSQADSYLKGAYAFNKDLAAYVQYYLNGLAKLDGTATIGKISAEAWYKVGTGASNGDFNLSASMPLWGLTWEAAYDWDASDAVPGEITIDWVYNF